MFSPVCPQSPTGVSLSKYLSHHPPPPSPYGQQRGPWDDSCLRLGNSYMYTATHAAATSLQARLTRRTTDHQALLSVGFSREEHWSGLPAPLQGIFPTQGSSPPSSVSCISGQAPYYQCRLGGPPCPRTCFTSHHDPPQVFPSNTAGVLNNKVLATHRPQSQMEMRR